MEIYNELKNVERNEDIFAREISLDNNAKGLKNEKGDKSGCIGQDDSHTRYQTSNMNWREIQQEHVKEFHEVTFRDTGRKGIEATLSDGNKVLTYTKDDGTTIYIKKND